MRISQAAFPDLATLRRQKGVSLDAISNATRIAKRYLEAIERGAFTVLPGGIYDISYIRQYARAVDLEEHELLEFYYAATNCPAPAASAAVLRDEVAPVAFRQYLPLIPRALFNVSIRKLRKT